MKAVSICTDSQSQKQLEYMIARHGEITLSRSLSAYPDMDTLGRILRAWAPSMVFLDLRHPAVEQTNTFIAAEFPAIRRIAIHPAQLPEVFRRVLHLGMTELVSPPFKQSSFKEALDRVAAHIEANPVEDGSGSRLVSYLPAKAGVGASTLIAHATWAAAEDKEARVLLADFDAHSGIVSFLFNVEHEYSLGHALAQGHQLDEDIWRGLVRSVNNVDLLISKPGSINETRDERHVPELLQFAQRNYTAIHADLPDTLDANTLAVLHASDQIYLVTTPELASLRLAKLKATALKQLDLAGRTMLVVNRMHARYGLSLKEIETAVGLEVVATFPCQYKSVANSIRDAKPCGTLLKSMREFSEKSEGRKPKPSYQKFTERFTVTSNVFDIRQSA